MVTDTTGIGWSQTRVGGGHRHGGLDTGCGGVVTDITRNGVVTDTKVVDTQEGVLMDTRVIYKGWGGWSLTPQGWGGHRQGARGVEEVCRGRCYLKGKDTV